MDENIENNENNYQTVKVSILKDKLFAIYKRNGPPNGDDYLEVVGRANIVLQNEDPNIRPIDSTGLRGGIINLKPGIPTLIVPDLHARLNFFLSIMLYTDDDDHSVLDRLAWDKLQVVCVGDGFHSEGKQVKRWKLAFDEFKELYKKHDAMDAEMRESMGIMEMVMELKCAFPQNFHFLKGNHENITNEKGQGNYPFRKFAYEGVMVFEYVKKFYGEQLLDSYSKFEKNLPLLAIGKNFLISHAEPKTLYTKDMVLDYRNQPDVVEGLTWTDNDGAEEGSVDKMLKHYIPPENWETAHYFGGHRIVTGLYSKRAKGKYIQIHNPNKFIVAIISENEEIDLEKCIIEIKNSMESTINME